MVGQPTVTKPSRSDEVLDPDQQVQIANHVRAQFESKAHKRPIKPNRSESESDSLMRQQEGSYRYMDDGLIPEFQKLQSLRSRSLQVDLPTGGDPEVGEEFVETEYYNKLVSIDKQHHTTGSGFISVVKEKDAGNGSSYELNRNIENEGERILFHSSGSNPATNDWIPTVEDDQVAYVSSKPSRSG